MENLVPFLEKIGLALLIGAMVGFEREWQRKPAGLRTHMLVTLSSTLLIILGGESVRYLEEEYPALSFSPDPMRLFEAIVVGVSFIGGGTIIKMKDEHTVVNLTTAASLLVSAVLGVAVGAGLYALACIAAVIVIVVNFVLGEVETHIWGEKNV